MAPSNVHMGSMGPLVCYRDFTDEDEALDDAIANQRDRKNLTDAECLRLVEVVHARRQMGGDRRSEEAKSKALHDAIEKSAYWWGGCANAARLRHCRQT